MTEFDRGPRARTSPIVLFAVTLLLLTQTTSDAEFQSGSFEFEGLTRNYEVFLPTNFEPNMPLVFLLHGYLQSTEVIIDYTLMHEVADTAGFVVVYPEAVWPGFNSGLTGYPGLPPIDLTVNDVGFLSALIDTVDARYDIDMHRIYSCGFSLGGEMTYRLAAEKRFRFAAFASVSGKLNYGIAASYDGTDSPKPILHFHGTDDEWEIYGWGPSPSNLWSVEATVDYWLDKNGCVDEAETTSVPDIDPTDGCTVEEIRYTDCSDSTCLIFYKILGGGHRWPGAPPDANPGGNTCLDIHANTIIWNFFKNYEVPVSAEPVAGSIPTELCLSRISPNPFRTTTSVLFDLPQIGDVRISVSDISGRLVRTDALGVMDAGSYRYLFNGSNLPSGAYFFRLHAEPHSEVRRILLVK